MQQDENIMVAGPSSGDRGNARRFDGTGRPSDRKTLALSSMGFSICVIVFTILTGFSVKAVYEANEPRNGLVHFAILVACSLTFTLLIPATKSISQSGRTRRYLERADLIKARISSVSAKDYANHAFGYGFVVATALLLVNFIFANDVAVGKTFFYLPLMSESFWLILKAFWVNVYIFVIAQALVLAWGLVVAVARLLPGKAAKPIRSLATLYTDVFRGMPAIITIYLVGFGIPLTGIPILKDFSPEFYAILALTLTYGAYVSEVYRSGIESIHWSQVAGARSLGLSHFQTLRYVVVPQAVRRIIPPLLNDFIGLQKDTALVNVIGALDAFNQAKIVASNNFNLSAVTTVAFLFIVITIPQARFVDKLIERDHRRMRAG